MANFDVIVIFHISKIWPKFLLRMHLSNHRSCLTVTCNRNYVYFENTKICTIFSCTSWQTSSSLNLNWTEQTSYWLTWSQSVFVDAFKNYVFKLEWEFRFFVVKNILIRPVVLMEVLFCSHFRWRRDFELLVKRDRDLRVGNGQKGFVTGSWSVVFHSLQ